MQEDGRKLGRTTEHKPLRVPARAVPQRDQPSAMTWVRLLKGKRPWRPREERTLSRRDPIDRRAGCGKSARPVRREGWRQRAIPTPIFPARGALARFNVSTPKPLELLKALLARNAEAA